MKKNGVFFLCLLTLGCAAKTPTVQNEPASDWSVASSDITAPPAFEKESKSTSGVEGDDSESVSYQKWLQQQQTQTK